MENFSVTILPPFWTLTPDAQALSDELARRIADPQDLEDGLLAVYCDEIIADMIHQSDYRVLSALLGP